MSDQLDVKKYVDQFSSWILGETTIEKINSWNDLREEVLRKATNDYLFFPFLVGCVERYISRNFTQQELMGVCMGLIRDLFFNGFIIIYHVDSVHMKEANLQGIKDQDEMVINKIQEDWIALNLKIPEVNEVAWFTATEKGEAFIKHK